MLGNCKGGDIDLFFETDALPDNRAEVLCQLHGALTLALGERKIDVILKDAKMPPAPVFEIAKHTGIPLCVAADPIFLTDVAEFR